MAIPQTLPAPLAAPTSRPAWQRATRADWIELASEFDDHSFQHCWDYAEMLAARSRASVENVVVGDPASPIGLAGVRIKRLPGLQTGIAYVPAGPLVRRRDGADTTRALEAVLTALRREYVERRGLVLRIAPTVADPEWDRLQRESYAAAGFSPSPDAQPYRTMVVDIERPLVDVRASLAQKWRNCLNKSERKEIDVLEGHGPELFESFAPLFDELVARKAFEAGLGVDFYAPLQARLPESERLYLAIARVDGVAAAGVVASMHGDTAVYLLGASNDAARKVNAAYLLQWRAIEAATRRGCRRYDLGGVDAEANPGVYKFKAGLGGDELVAPGPFELAPGRLRLATVRAAERAFRTLAARRRH
jgi:hypothetical protein